MGVPGPLDAATQQAYIAGKDQMLADLQAEIPGIVLCGSGGGTMKGVFGTSVQKGVAAGAMFEAKGHEVCSGNNAGDPNDPKIQTELAAFLVAAGEHSYYRCGAWGHSDVPWYKVYDMPLGKPFSNATLSNGIYKRSFASGTVVTFDTATETGTIKWADSHQVL